MTNRNLIFSTFLIYLAFVIYGSLVPLDFHYLPIDQAWLIFHNIPYLKLGVASRADWIANIVLYIPLAFWGCAWATGYKSNRLPGLTVFGIFLFCITVAIAVEFTQIFFAPRTVSLNDLIAETLGTIGGVTLWVLGHRRITKLWKAFREGGRESVLAALTLLSVAYVVLSLFPYDFVISPSELSSALSSGRHGWLLAGNCSADWIRCSARQIGELIAITPLGILIGLAFPKIRYQRIFLIGIALGFALEILQLLLVSGTSQGISIILRGVGLLSGTVIGHSLNMHRLVPVARIIWRITPFVALPYLLFVTAVNGLFSRPWLGLADGLSRFNNVRIMPFYYHYFSSEAAAMASLFAQAVMYAPIGIVLWAGYFVKSQQAAPKFLLAALVTIGLSLPIEVGKLMVPSKHPDFTNILIGATSAFIIWALAYWVQCVLTSKKLPQGANTSAKNPSPAQSIARPRLGSAGIIMSCAAGFTIIVGIGAYPVGKLLLVLLLSAYAVLLYLQPWLWLFAIPALLPTLDLSPITGRLMLDEFDLFVLVSIAVGYWRVCSLKPQPWPNRLFPIAVTLLWGTWVIATLRGIWPIFFMEGGLADSSHSPFGAWYVGKGLLWALLLIPLIRRIPVQTTEKIQRWILHGLITGLAIVAMVVLWERYVYVGLTNFDNVFRVTGTFSSMNTGGAYIEAFIAFALPALAVWILEQRRKSMVLIGLIGIAVTSYVMFVTFSRGGYVGFIAGLGLVFLNMVRLRASTSSRRRLIVVGLVAAAVAAVAIPVLLGGFAKYRLSRSLEDLAIRKAHWTQALDLMDTDIITKITGMGFGQYPTIYLNQANLNKIPGRYKILKDSGNPFLRLGAGESVFLDQIVHIDPNTDYLLNARVRQPYGTALLNIPVCKKALLYSFDCDWHQLVPNSQGTTWQNISIPLATEQTGTTNDWFEPPVKLSLHNPGSNAVDVDDVSLRTKSGQELLKNGDFSKGTKRWLFVTDQDLAWHIHQQEIEMYFAQGFLGILAFVVLLVAVTKSMWTVLAVGNNFATAIAGGLIGFITVGLLGSTMDAARLSILFYLGALLGGLLVMGKAHMEK